MHECSLLPRTLKARFWGGTILSQVTAADRNGAPKGLSGCFQGEKCPQGTHSHRNRKCLKPALSEGGAACDRRGAVRVTRTAGPSGTLTAPLPQHPHLTTASWAGEPAPASTTSWRPGPLSPSGMESWPLSGCVTEAATSASAQGLFRAGNFSFQHKFPRPLGCLLCHRTGSCPGEGSFQPSRVA